MNGMTKNARVPADRILTVILGGGQGTRLFPLTKLRSKPAVPLGGSAHAHGTPQASVSGSR